MHTSILSRFDSSNLDLFPVAQQKNCLALLARAAGAPRAVYVLLAIVGRPELDNEADIRVVDACATSQPTSRQGAVEAAVRSG
jgi:hypothetical protein